MAYQDAPADAVKVMIARYKVLSDSLPNQATDTDKARVTSQMQSLGTQIEASLNASMRIVAANFAEHKRKAEQWNKDAQTALKNVKEAAAAYKKAPSTDKAAAVRGNIQRIARYEHDFTQDAHDYGAAWVDFRAYNPGEIPLKYKKTFTLERSKVVNGQQGTVLLANQVAAALKSAESFSAIVDKAKMKSEVKAGTGTVRDISQAQQAATTLAQKLAAELLLLKTPTGMTPKPTAISTGAMMLKQISTTKNLLTDKNDLEQARGSMATTESAYKSMTTRLASMEKILATTTKGFKSTELSDATVKAQLVKANQSVKDARAEVKKYDKDYAAAKKAMAVVEATAKKLKL